MVDGNVLATVSISRLGRPMPYGFSECACDSGELYGLCGDNTLWGSAVLSDNAPGEAEG